MYTAGLLATRKYCTFLRFQPSTYWSQPQTAAVERPTPALQCTYTVCPFSSSAWRRHTACGSIWTRPGIERAQHRPVRSEPRVAANSHSSSAPRNHSVLAGGAGMSELASLLCFERKGETISKPANYKVERAARGNRSALNLHLIFL